MNRKLVVYDDLKHGELKVNKAYVRDADGELVEVFSREKGMSNRIDHVDYVDVRYLMPAKNDIQQMLFRFDKEEYTQEEVDTYSTQLRRAITSAANGGETKMNSRDTLIGILDSIYDNPKHRE